VVSQTSNIYGVYGYLSAGLLGYTVTPVGFSFPIHLPSSCLILINLTFSITGYVNTGNEMSINYHTSSGPQVDIRDGCLTLTTTGANINWTTVTSVTSAITLDSLVCEVGTNGSGFGFNNGSIFILSV
jgi:hypothetical protein